MNKLTRKLLNEAKSAFYRVIYKIKKRPDYRKKIDLFNGEKKKRKELFGVRKKLWPKNYFAAFNLQFDDFCTRTDEKKDLGGIPNKGVNKIFFNNLKKFPFVKTTLFTIPDLIEPNICENYSITNHAHKKWLNWVKSKKFAKIEIADHGLNHYQNDVSQIYPAGEFIAKNLKNSYETLLKAKDSFFKAGIKVKGTRPPMYELGRKFEFIESSKKAGFSYVAASTPIYGLNLFKKRVSNIYPEFYGGILNLPSNISIHQKLSEVKKDIDKIIEMNGLITLRGHYILGTSELANGINEETLKNMSEIITYISKNYAGKIWFATLEEIAKWWIS